MPKTIQVRNVPEKLHRKLKSRAAIEGLSLSDFVLSVLSEMEQLAERPSMKELAERIASRPAVKHKRSPAEIIREERARRDRALARVLDPSLVDSNPAKRSERTHCGKRTRDLRHPEAY